MRIVISGATGLIGTALAASLDRDGIEVTRLVRRSPASPGRGQLGSAGHAAGWTRPCSAAPTAWCTCPARRSPAAAGPRPASGSCATAGSPAPGPSSRPSRPRRIPPPALLCASAIGWYGDTGDRPVTESAPAGSGFLADAGPRLGGRRGRRPGGHPGGEPAQRPGAVRPRRGPGPAAAAVPAGPRRPAGHRPPVPELDRQDRRGPGHPLPARPPRGDRAGEPDRARAGHQRRSSPRRWPAPCTGPPCWPCPPWRCAPGSARPPASCWAAPGCCREKLEQAGFSFRYPAIAAALAAELSGQASAA